MKKFASKLENFSFAISAIKFSSFAGLLVRVRRTGSRIANCIVPKVRINRVLQLALIPVILLFSACALEIANVIGPGGGYVFYDKGNYKGGWRYKECSPFDLVELKNDTPESLKRAAELCAAQSEEWYVHNWEIPDEDDLKKILECFSYGLTRFSPDYYYLALSLDQPGYDAADPTTWKVAVLHKSFDKKANGAVEKITDTSKLKIIRVRPVRKF